MTTTKIIDRIRKLLELSKSSNEHEAAQAAARAADLMLQHQIDQAELEPDVAKAEPITEEVVDDKNKWRVQWRLNLVSGLAKSLGGHCYFQGGRYSVIGSKSVIATVRYMYSYLVPEVERLADLAYKQEAEECRRSDVDPPSARAWKGSFRVGCSLVIRQRLVEQREKTFKKARAEGKTQALAIVDKEKTAVQEYIAQTHGRFRTVGSNAGRRSTSGYEAGAAAGRDVNLGGGKAIGAGNRRLPGGGK